ncbi:phage shock protein C (PspC) family protein [Keratinibaculum paraultunense]|uniref:Phage shock protein C (PspC) family protein n=1 Tax=Keratinibaculum paraultunense TaxID=1278232 RepID=A0A4R3KRC6_9FIRM|nr:PspC domain-containing protein [Keratinibaculum paraultunense]QQY78802.1 PspC domain-containing protein [Keratinibaculum paraultunense]TCS87488.1 phage shock protein C (PspC) family protein [Keratinibaculum paraultunense]
MEKKLKRSRNDRMIAGVCGGIAEYFNIDPTIVRIIWVLLCFVPGSPGLLAYLICALIIPEDDGVIYQDEKNNINPKNTALFIGLALIIIGGAMLMKVIWPQFAFKIMNIGKYWPVLLIIFGLYIIINQTNKK